MSRSTHACPPISSKNSETRRAFSSPKKNGKECRDWTLTDEIKVTIAGHAAWLVLGFDEDYFPNVETVIVYPQGFVVPPPARRQARPAG